MRTTIQPQAQHFAAVLQQQLPDIPRAHVAAVLLRLGNLLVHTHSGLARDETLTKTTALLHLASMPGAIGEYLHTGYQLPEAPAMGENTTHGEFSIHGDTDDDGREYVYVLHDRCGAWVFGGPGDPYELSAAELPARIADHRCSQPLATYAPETSKGA